MHTSTTHSDEFIFKHKQTNLGNVTLEHQDYGLRNHRACPEMRA